MKQLTITENDFILGREEIYDPKTQHIISYKQVTDIVDGIECRFSNMAGGFPFEFESVTWANSEILYLSGEFSTNTERHQSIQTELRNTTSGYAAKRFIKAKYKKEVRADFTEFRLQWMLFVVWQKCLGNADFCQRLLQTPLDSILVENTTTDNGGTAEIWGCKNPELVRARKAIVEKLTAENPHLTKKELYCKLNIETNKIRDIGVWVGQNNIGKILMICRKAIAEGKEPVIDYHLLNQYDIYILGKRIDFTQYGKC